MPIIVTCTCGKKLRVADEKAGKRMKCPDCKEILSVPALSEDVEQEKPRQKTNRKPEPPEDDDDEEKSRPKAKRKQVSDDDSDDDSPKKKSKAARALAKSSGGKIMLIVGLGVILLGGCGASIGLGIWFFLGSGSGIQNQIVGVWQVDLDATKTLNPAKWNQVSPHFVVEFNKDGTFRFTNNYLTASKIETGTWTVIPKAKDGPNVQMTIKGWAIPNEAFRMTPKGKDTLVLDKHAYKPDVVLKRVSEFPQAPKMDDDNLLVIQPRTQFELGLGKSDDEKRVERLFLSRDGRRVAVANNGVFSGTKHTRKTQVWDVAGDPKKLQEYEGDLIALSPSGKRIIHHRNSSTRLTDVDTGNDLGDVQMQAPAIFQSDDLIWGFPGYFDQKPKNLLVRKLDQAAGKKVEQIVIADDDRGYFASPFSDNKEFFFVPMSDKVQGWDSANQKLREIPLKIETGDKIDYGLGRSAIVVSPDGKWLAMRVKKPNEQVSVVFDLATGTVAAKLPPRVDAFNARFVPNRDMILTIRSPNNKDWEIAAYDFKKNLVVAACRTSETYLQTPVLSDDGSTLAVGTKNGKVLIWDLKQLK